MSVRIEVVEERAVFLLSPSSHIAFVCVDILDLHKRFQGVASVLEGGILQVRLFQLRLPLHLLKVVHKVLVGLMLHIALVLL